MLNKRLDPIHLLGFLFLLGCASDPATSPPVLSVQRFSPLRARMGEELILRGQGFGVVPAKVTVLINGKAASVTSAQDSLLSVLVPEGAGNGSVQVKVDDQLAAADGAFEYLFTATTQPFAGGSEGTANGKGEQAQFFHPYNITADAQGNFYVADQINSRIQKITPDGTTSTLAGGVQGFADGKGESARLRFPIGVFAAANGTVYVADAFNHSIRTIAPDGSVKTLVGRPDRVGKTDGILSEARLQSPYGVYLDRANVLWICDTENSLIRQVTTDGRLVTQAGSELGHQDGKGAAARFNWPAHLTMDAQGTAYVADKQNHCLRKIAPDGTVTTLVGNPGTKGFADGLGKAAQFNQTSSVSLDEAGNVYVTDLYNHRIRGVTPSGYVYTLAGDGTAGYAEGAGTLARFHYPQGCLWQPGNRLFVTDSYNNRIRVLTLK